MKSQLATAFVPFEIGDIVKLKRGKNHMELVEIKLEQYVAANKAKVSLQVRNIKHGNVSWVLPENIERVRP